MHVCSLVVYYGQAATERIQHCLLFISVDKELACADYTGSNRILLYETTKYYNIDVDIHDGTVYIIQSWSG